MIEIDVKNQPRFTDPHKERSTLSYVWGTMGALMLLTVAFSVLVVYASFLPASAQDVRVIKDAGAGFYDVKELEGPAGKELKAFLDESYVDCQFHDEVIGKCNLNRIADDIDDIRVDTSGAKAIYALVFIHYEPDDGNSGSLLLALWQRRDDGSYRLIATGQGWNLFDAKAVGMEGDTIVLSGLTVGPKDPSCCATDATVYKVSFADGKLSVSLKRSTPRLDDTPGYMRLVEDSNFTVGRLPQRPHVASKNVRGQVPNALAALATGPGVQWPDMHHLSFARPPHPLTQEDVVPADGASPISIIGFLLKTNSPDVEWNNNSPAMRRILSYGLANAWTKGDAAAKKLNEPLLDANWINGSQDFDMVSWEAKATAPGMVVTVLKGRAGETQRVNFMFIEEGHIWRIADVLYLGGERAVSLRHICDEEISNAHMPSASPSPFGRSLPPYVGVIDLAKGTLNGEAGTTFNHNGSEVLVFERAGVIVYDKPKAAIAGTVRPGDVLFSGRISARLGVQGTAYTFRRGCNPAPYVVTGGFKSEGYGGRNEIDLSGAAPIADALSCEIKGYSTKTPNARLHYTFDAGDL